MMAYINAFLFHPLFGGRHLSCLHCEGCEGALLATVISVVAGGPGRPFLSELFNQCSDVLHCGSLDHFNL